MHQLLRLNLILILVSGIFFSVNAQQTKKKSIFIRYLHRLFNDTTESSRPQFISYPTVAYAPETSWELAINSLFVYYAKQDTSNRLSEVSALTFLTFQKQYGVILDNALYSDKNKWFLLGHTKFQSYPLLYFGVGSDTDEEHIAQVNAVTLQMRQRLLRKIYRNLYVGAEFDFQRLSSVSFIPSTQNGLHLPTGHSGSTNLELGTGIIYDNRHNVLNVRRGLYAEIAYLHSDTKWGSNYTFSTLFIENRVFHPIGKRNVLAFHTIGQFNFGTTPFNQLALMGGESIMRGYYLGRYRDKHLVATQVEFRMLPLPFRYTKRWGLAAFIATGSVFSSFNNVPINKFVVAGGAGIRFLIYPEKNIYTRADLAFTREKPGLYIYIGESF